MIVRQGTIEEAVAISQQIPELVNPYNVHVYEERLGKADHLILVAETDTGEQTGFKVGYDRYHDGSFYSWMGGLLPAYRGHNVYQQLTATMEDWAAEAGFSHILLKTRNRLVPMIRFCLSQGYYVSGFSAHTDPRESRIYFRKELATKK